MRPILKAVHECDHASRERVGHMASCPDCGMFAPESVFVGIVTTVVKRRGAELAERFLRTRNHGVVCDASHVQYDLIWRRALEALLEEAIEEGKRQGRREGIEMVEKARG
jgi:hypothetical protein